MPPSRRDVHDAPGDRLEACRPLIVLAATRPANRQRLVSSAADYRSHRRRQRLVNCWTAPDPIVR